MKKRELVIGDVHGAFKALKQVLERCEYNPKKDKLIFLGDYVDGWSETSELVQYLIELKKENDDIIFVRGNHDVWCYDYLHFGRIPLIWTQQGGQATIDSYIKTGLLVNQEHRDFFKNQVDYYLDDENRLFIHGGWCYLIGFPEGALTKVNAGSIAKECHWDRSIFETARTVHLMCKNNPDAWKKFDALNEFKEVYVGHTARKNGPENYLNLWNVDTGAGWNGKLTAMNINTKEIYQSDKCSDLYFGENGRQ